MRTLTASAVVVLTLITPLLAQDAPRLRFDVVSVKENTGADLSISFAEQPPDGYRHANAPLESYIPYAFEIPQRSRVIGIPEWARSARYDIVAKASRPITEAERRAMVRDVLETRFRLKTHTESRPQTVYVMTKSRRDGALGAGFTPRPECATSKCDSGGTGRPDSLKMSAMTVENLARMFSSLLGQVVYDETGVNGTFDIALSWRPDTAASDPNDTRPSLFTAVQEQLGLKLETQRRPVDVLIIDSIDRPSPD